MGIYRQGSINITFPLPWDDEIEQIDQRARDAGTYDQRDGTVIDEAIEAQIQAQPHKIEQRFHVKSLEAITETTLFGLRLDEHSIEWRRVFVDHGDERLAIHIFQNDADRLAGLVLL